MSVMSFALFRQLEAWEQILAGHKATNMLKLANKIVLIAVFW